MRVAITGWAWRTPLGGTIDAAVSRLLAGERAAVANPRGAGFACTAAAAIVDPPATPPRQARFLRRMGLYGLEVAREALAMARGAGSTHDGRGSAAPAPAASERFGLFSGVGGLRAHWDDMMAGLAQQRDDGAGAWARGLQNVHPYWMLRHLSNNVHALASAELGLRGEGATFGGGNASAQAIAAASRALHAGAIDAALVVTYDSLLEPETLVELGARRAATHVGAGEVVAPYDRRAAGFVPGEAAAALVLVRADDARGAAPLVHAGGARDAVLPADADAAHHAAPLVHAGGARATAADGSRATFAAPLAWLEVADTADGAPGEPDVATMAGALRRLTATRESPDLDAAARVVQGEPAGAMTPLAAIDGAARAWPDLDAAERAMLGALIGATTPLTAITAAMGQLGAATSAVQAIALAECLRRGMLPPIAGLADAADGLAEAGLADAADGRAEAGLVAAAGVPLVPVTRATATDARTALGIATAAPGLVGAIRVEVPMTTSAGLGEGIR